MTRAKSCCFIQDKMWKKKNQQREKRRTSQSVRNIGKSLFSLLFFLLMLTNVLSHKCKFIESLLGRSRSCAQKLTRVYL